MSTHDEPNTVQQPETDTDPFRVLDSDGHLRVDAETLGLSENDRLALYEHIKRARHFDQRMLSLQRQGRIGTYAPMTGQEGTQVATSYALDEQDWLFPTYREHAAKHVHGIDLASLVRSLMGYEYAVPEDTNVMPEYIPIATQIPHAVGLAWACTLRGDHDTAVVCHLGDGATSEGDFHEGLNFAGVFDVPVVFVCNNNQWAISVPRERQTASETLAGKASAYGFDGVRVDGLDPLAVYAVTRNALRKAKTPGDDEHRPTLIESVQYRYGAHTTADDPSVYREKAAVEEWKDRDPLDRLETHLYRTGLLDTERETTITDRIESQVQDAIDEAGSVTIDPERMFEHIYDTAPDRLQTQGRKLDAIRQRNDEQTFTSDGN